ncbi:MAG TPA: YihY/virulence factor BrkB family protein [Chthoniobacterales bacterium]|nr:YihY/virulence factor BrkB family protein [Chthoniobacterales bacterium]
MATTEQSFISTLTPKNLWGLFVTTFNEWLEDKAPQLGAALAYYTVFSLAPLILVLLAIVGLIFRNDPNGAWDRITDQMRYIMDPSGVQVVQDIARTAAKPSAGFWATLIGIALALFGASGVFGQLQDALNTIWGVKAKPGAAVWDYIRIRFLSFAMVAGVCFLLLVSLTVEALLNGFSQYLERTLPGGAALGFTIYMIVDLCMVVLLFAVMFKYLPDVQVRWRDVVVGAAMTAGLFLIGKWALGLYLGSGAAGSAYGAASSLVTLLIWIYYSSQILLFGAEFTQVYANRFGAGGKPSKHAVCIATTEKEISAPGEDPMPQVREQVQAEAQAAEATKS